MQHLDVTATTTRTSLNSHKHSCRWRLVLLLAGVLVPLLHLFGVDASAGEPKAEAKGEAKDAKPEEKKDDKDKPPSIKYSAWCAFRDLSTVPVPVKPDPKTDQTRPGITQFNGFGRRGRWAHVVLEVQNTTEKDNYRGTASIVFNPTKENAAGQVPYRTTYRQEVEIGPQSEKQIRFSVLCPEEGWSDALQIHLTLNGRPYDPRLVVLRDLDADDSEFICVISESSGAFRSLGTRRRNLEDDVDGEMQRQIAVVEPSEVPRRWHDLMLANLIVIDGPPRDKLTDDQWAALRSYVQAGGHILITADKDPGRLKGPLEELAGITVREMIEVASLDAIVPGFTPNRPELRLPMLDISAAQETKENGLVRYNPKTQYVEMTRRFYGSGSVTFLPFSLSDTLLEHWDGRRKIPLAILDQGRQTSLFYRKDPEQQKKQPNPFLYVQEEAAPTGLAALRTQLEDSFRNDTPVQLQKPPMVLSFLLLYLLCAVPGNYLLFGWFRRREVAWLAVPLWTASFSILAYVIGYMGQTGELTINQVSVVEAAPRQEMALARTFMGVYAPRRDDYHLEFPPMTLRNDVKFDAQAAPGHLIDITRAEARNIDLPDLYLVDGDTGISIDRLLVQQRSTRQLEILHRASLGNGLDVKVRERKENKSVLDLNITNNLGHDLLYPVYIYEGRAIALGNEGDGTRLPAGASAQFLGLGGNAVPWGDVKKLFLERNITFRGVRGVHATKRAQAITEFLRQRLDAYVNGVVCAWVEGGALDVRIGASGYPAEPVKNKEGMTLLIVPVAIREDSARLDFATTLKISYAADADTNPDPTWAELTTSRLSPKATNPDREVVFLSLEVPEAARNLANSGYRLQFRFAVAMEGPKGNQQAAATGDVKVEVRRKDDKDRLKWEEVSSNIFQDLYTIRTYTNPTLYFKLDDFRIRQDNNIVLRITLKKFGDKQKLELRNIDYKLVREDKR